VPWKPPYMNAWLYYDLIVYENLLVFIQFNTQIDLWFLIKSMVLNKEWMHIKTIRCLSEPKKPSEKGEEVVSKAVSGYNNVVPAAGGFSVEVSRVKAV
jgi:hypothetical protein